jgi:hypothetical protein
MIVTALATACCDHEQLRFDDRSHDGNALYAAYVRTGVHHLQTPNHDRVRLPLGAWAGRLVS